MDVPTYGVNDSSGMFPLIHKQVAWELTRNLAVIFRHRVTGGSLRNVGDQPMLSLPKVFLAR